MSPDIATHGLAAATIYGDADARAGLDKVMPLYDYFVAQEPEEIRQALYAILCNGMGKVYARHTVEPKSVSALLETYLPENLVVSLAGAGPHGAVYPSGRAPAGAAKAAPRLSPRDLGNSKWPAQPGDLVFLQGFHISKMQTGDLNLEEPKGDEPSRYKVKVCYFPPGASQLAVYAAPVDTGAGFLERVHFPFRTPYAMLAMVLQRIEKKAHDTRSTNKEFVQRGFEVLDYLCGLEFTGIHSLDTNTVPHETPFWQISGRLDHKCFL